MPNQYVRKSSERGKWSQNDLTQAIVAVRTRNASIRQAALEYGVPRKTLERRLKSKNFLKGPMGPSSVFGPDHERRLVRHIINMQKNCFPLTPKDLRSIAYLFAEQLGIKHSFNRDKEEAGYVWLKSFLSRNPEIRTRKAEGVSLARCQALSREEINAYFDILRDLLEKYELFDKPSNIFNMDETGLQLNSRPGHVLAEKGSKAVSTVTSTEKGETVTVIACCNAEGTFLPPACIMKGKNKKLEWQDGMPPGSVLYMSQKSAYINAHIFFEWLKSHFIPRKPAGQVLLILDGHTSHCNSVEMLEFATNHEICLLTLPSHTTHYLQTLDRSVFKSVKSFYYEACRIWLKRNPGRRLTRLQFGELLSVAWGKAATSENAIAGFKATGVYPFNRLAIPDCAFAMTDLLNNENRDPLNDKQPNFLDVEVNQASTSGIEDNGSREPPADEQSDFLDVTYVEIPEIDQTGTSEIQDTQRLSSPSILVLEHTSPFEELATTAIENIEDTPSKLIKETAISALQDTKETPSKFLTDISPILEKSYPARKRAKQVATLLTSDLHINYRKDCDKKKNVVIEKRKIKQEKSTNKEFLNKENRRELQKNKSLKRQESSDTDIEEETITQKKKRKPKESTSKECDQKKNRVKLQIKKCQKWQESTDTEDEDEPVLIESGESSPIEISVNDCVGCGENYYETQLTEDWIQCTVCQRWVHENCTEFDDKCHPCGMKVMHLKRRGRRLDCSV